MLFKLHISIHSTRQRFENKQCSKRGVGCGCFINRFTSTMLVYLNTCTCNTYFCKKVMKYFFTVNALCPNHKSKVNTIKTGKLS